MSPASGHTWGEREGEGGRKVGEGERRQVGEGKKERKEEVEGEEEGRMERREDGGGEVG